MWAPPLANMRDYRGTKAQEKIAANGTWRDTRRMRWFLPFVTVIVFVAATGANADELKLKDGTKIVGTIVGFEDSSFKVKTSYGFAVVQRDQVVSISVADASKKPEPDKKPESVKKTPDDKSASSAKQAKSASSPAAAIVETPRTDAKPAANGSVVALDGANTASATNTGSPAPVNAVPASTPSFPAVAPKSASASAPPAAPKPVTPETIREEVAGNAYVNDTYGFRMYKPPDWELIAGARTVLPGAITAMGTGDQTTYLLIGQEPAGKSLATEMDATEMRLRDIMDNFRPLGQRRITVSGSEAMERRFRGSVDQHDWSGTVVLVPRGAKVYTIFGMTYADSDLVQIQENVISRAISSLQFTKP